MLLKRYLLSSRTLKLFQKPSFSTDIKNILTPTYSIDEASLDKWSTPVNPLLRNKPKDQSHTISPDETTVILFPGQGSQFVGMGKQLIDIPKAKELYEIASEILGYNLLDMCLYGPKEKLNQTEYSQPAIFVTSLASLEKLKLIHPQAIERCMVTAGFSLGEFTSLCFAGAIQFENALRLVKIRAEAMQHASEITPGGMMTVFYYPKAKLNFACLAAREWCATKNIEPVDCIVANHLIPTCKVISGNLEALKFIEMNAKDFGIKWVKYLPVSGAFHSKLMEPAAEVLEKALKKTLIQEPIIATYSNVEGKRYRSPEKIRSLLLKQMYSPVKWEQIVIDIFERKTHLEFPSTYECGPGKNLKTLIRQINGKIWKKMESISV